MVRVIRCQSLELAYYDQWLAFVRTFGTRYDTNPALAYVIITGFMQTNGMFLAAGVDEAAFWPC